jgi:hypothetical protein
MTLGVSVGLKPEKEPKTKSSLIAGERETCEPPKGEDATLDPVKACWHKASNFDP